jgi:hypothetical protein
MSIHTSKYIPPNNYDELVLAWIRRARESQFAHYEQATRLRRGSTLLGIPVIIITAIVGTTVFSSIAQATTSDNVKIVVGLLSVSASVLSSLQTFMKLSEKAEQHRVFGARYGGIRRKLEHIYAARESQPITSQLLDYLNNDLNALAEEAPDVPAKAIKKIQATAVFSQVEQIAAKG